LDGTRTAADSETLVADVTAMTTNAYYQTTKRLLGTVTYTLTGAGGATVFAADFNYGLAVYSSFDQRKHTIKLFKNLGRASANDAGFDIELLFHKLTGWTYSAAAFIPGTTALCSMATEYSTESDLTSGQQFSYDRELIQEIDGTAGEGFLIRVTTSANNAVEFMTSVVFAEVVPNDHHLKNTGQAAHFMYNGSVWMLV
jgi:hypothetical protein